jgi:hypothetical protein
MQENICPLFIFAPFALVINELIQDFMEPFFFITFLFRYTCNFVRTGFKLVKTICKDKAKNKKVRGNYPTYSNFAFKNTQTHINDLQHAFLVLIGCFLSFLLTCSKGVDQFYVSRHDSQGNTLAVISCGLPAGCAIFFCKNIVLRAICRCGLSDIFFAVFFLEQILH